jgi:2-polyprenyl-3-methyl-5-hydroxy-6-metoxy-1,4-benzoquinol methylase
MLDARIYEEKDSSYFDGARPDFVAALPDNADGRIIEIGCANGGTGHLALRHGKCRSYVGIDIMPEAAEAARRRLSKVLVGDVESMDLPFAPETFDALILSEVLEHLIDPWRALDRLTALLKPGGLVFASSPNVAHHSVVRGLLAGRWELAEHGVMDRTHLRWFTPKSFRAMFEGVGVRVAHIGPVAAPGRRARLVSALTGGRLDHLLIRQICLHGVKLPE